MCKGFPKASKATSNRDEIMWLKGSHKTPTRLQIQVGVGDQWVLSIRERIAWLLGLGTGILGTLLVLHWG